MWISFFLLNLLTSFKFSAIFIYHWSLFRALSMFRSCSMLCIAIYYVQITFLQKDTIGSPSHQGTAVEASARKSLFARNSKEVSKSWLAKPGELSTKTTNTNSGIMHYLQIPVPTMAMRNTALPRNLLGNGRLHRNHCIGKSLMRKNCANSCSLRESGFIPLEELELQGLIEDTTRIPNIFCAVECSNYHNNQCIWIFYFYFSIFFLELVYRYGFQTNLKPVQISTCMYVCMYVCILLISFPTSSVALQNAAILHRNSTKEKINCSGLTHKGRREGSAEEMQTENLVYRCLPTEFTPLNIQFRLLSHETKNPFATVAGEPLPPVSKKDGIYKYYDVVVRDLIPSRCACTSIPN